MVRVTKSPNIMSTTGRIPVMAAPTARPVNPASEIGVSSTRSLPNSSSKPDRTLKGVPASATSSPMMQTVLSRRISSANASRIACANVNSRPPASGIHVLVHFANGRIRCRYGEVDRLLHFGLEFSLNMIEHRQISKLFANQPLAMVRYGIAVRSPFLLFLLGAVILAIDVADVVSVVTIGVTEQKTGTIAAAGSLHKSLCSGMNRAHVQIGRTS